MRKSRFPASRIRHRRHRNGRHKTKGRRGGRRLAPNPEAFLSSNMKIKYEILLPVLLLLGAAGRLGGG